VNVELPWGLRLPMMVLWVEKDRAAMRFLGSNASGHSTAIRLGKRDRREPSRGHASKRHAGVQIETDRCRLGLLLYYDKPLGALLYGIRRRGLRSVLARGSVRHARCIGMRR
jgi:hypothetical protein